MKLLTERHWAQYSALGARLRPLPAAEQAAALQALRAAGAEDPHVLSLVALHLTLPPDPDRLRTGECVGNCTLEERLGAGGMGVVYRAQQHLGPAQRPVAVKLIQPALLQTAREEALPRFLAELHTLVALQHEHIVRLYDGGIAEDPATHDPLPYLVMELVPGGLPLTTYARDFALAWPERLAVFGRVCRAVQYAHEHRVLHRDLKPANILVDSDGRPFVIDFGLAQACEAVLPGSHLALSGTPAYMSPEQVSDAFEAVSAKSDVYALGLLLFELLTGQLPYTLPPGGTVAQWRQVITDTTPPLLREYDAAYEGEIEAIVAAALAKRPAERPTAAVLRARLERALQQLPSASVPLAPAPRQAQRDRQPGSPRSSRTPRATRGRTARGRRRPTAPPALDERGVGRRSRAHPPTSQAALPPAERRQLTVLACQWASVGAPAAPQDPEVLFEAAQDYHARCAAIIQRFDGHIVQQLSNGLLVYFGFPQAHEDAAHRAVRTALAIVHALGRPQGRQAQEPTPRLAVRVGIHTGRVVVGTLAGSARQEQVALGDTPHIAAELQRLAPPDTVVSSAATWQLVQGYFLDHALGPQPLPEVSPAIQVHQILAERGIHSRLDVATPRGLAPLVGREAEVTLLRDLWAHATEGQGQVVVLSGEAGMGKSRLAQALKAHVAGASHTLWECRCSPYYQNTALYPLMPLLQRLLHWQPDDTPAEQLRHLEQVLGQYRLPVAEAVPLLAPLLGLSLPDARYAPLTLAPERQQHKTLDTLLAILVASAERQGVLFIVEDLHWGDPTTVAFLTRLLDQVPMTHLLTLLVGRPEFQPPWPQRAHLTSLTLRRLASPQVEQLLTWVAGGKTLPPAMVQDIVTKTDGVPLFVEELTKTVLESGLLREEEEHYTLLAELPPLAIPATLHDALMARLDRLGGAKGLAQLGATIGRMFAYDLLWAVSPLDETTLQHSLRQLVEAELVYQRGVGTEAIYRFKHALIQEAAYQSLLRGTRQHYHQRIAQVLAERFPQRAEARPEVLAHHYTEAGLSASAIGSWQRAAQQAHTRSAPVEASRYLRRALELLMALPETPERARQELPLRLGLGRALQATQGQAAPEVGQAYTRAQALVQHVPDPSQRFAVLFGLWQFHMYRAELQTAHTLGRQLLELAQRHEDTALRLQAHRALTFTLLSRGDVGPAYQHAIQGLQHYDTQSQRPQAFVAGQEHGLICRAHAAQALWMLGYPTQALQNTLDTLALARTWQHPYSVVSAQGWAAWLHLCRREWGRVQEYAEAAVTLATEYGFTLWVGHGMLLQGWAMAMLGQTAAGIRQIRQGLATIETTGTALTRPHGMLLLAEVYGKAGHTTEGRSILAAAHTMAYRHGELLYAAELHRRAGELCLADPQEDQGEAEASFRRALDLARIQQAKSLVRLSLRIDTI